MTGNTPQPRIDINTFTSEAIRELADREPALTRDRDAAVGRSREHLAAMTKQQILAAFAGDVERGRIRETRAAREAGKLPKGELVEAVAEAYGDASDAGAELARLRNRAAADWHMAHRTNELIDQAEMWLSKVHGDGGLYSTADNVRAYAAQLQAAVVVVRNYAQVLVGAVAAGEDIHAVARRLLDNAVKTIGGFPNIIAAGSGAGSERAHDAAAAKTYAHTYTWTYGGLGEEYLNISLALLI